MHPLSLRDKEGEEVLSKFLLGERVLAHPTTPKGQLSLREKASETPWLLHPSTSDTSIEASAWAVGAAGARRFMHDPGTVTLSLCPLQRLKVLLQTRL